MDAYRTPAVTDADPLPSTCVPERATPWRPLPSTLSRALAAATMLFLLVSSVSIAAVAWTVTSRRVPAADLPQVQVQQAAAPAAAPRPLSCARPAPEPRMAREDMARVSRLHPPRRRLPPSALALLGPAETHDVNQLWSRALALRSHTSTLSVSRVDMPVRSLAPEVFAQDHIHVVRSAGAWGASGLRVAEIGVGSPARAGLRRGDLILGINGHTLDEPDTLLHVWSEVAAARAAVLEIERPGTGQLVLRIDFSA